MELDCRDQVCPMPIVRLAQSAKVLKAGDELTIQATDPAFRADLEAWIAKTGNVLVSMESKGTFVEAVIRKR